MKLPSDRPIVFFKAPRKREALLVKASSIPDGARWITVHPNGPGTEGSAVLIQPQADGSAHVIGGAGGKLNYLKLRGVRKESDYKKEAAEKKKAKAEDAKLQRAKDKEAGVLESKNKAKQALRDQLKKLMEESRSFESLPIRTRLTDTEVARFAAQRFRFPGVEIKARLFRNYPYGELASHVIGYIGRINQSEKEKLEESDNVGNYRGTDYIGKIGRAHV